MEITRPHTALEITTYDGDVYTVPRDEGEALAEALETNRFIKLQGELVAVRTIKRVRPIEELSVVGTLTKAQKSLLNAKCASYRKNLGQEPDEMRIQHWTSLILSGETLTIL